MNQVHLHRLRSRTLPGFLCCLFLAGSVAISVFGASVDTGFSKNDPLEPFKEQFSLEAALRFSQKSTDQWARDRNCVTCHTNGLHLISVSQLSPTSEGNQRTRKYAKDYLKRYIVDETPPSRQHGSVEGKVATTCFLVLSDMATNQELSPITRKGLEHLWTLQQEDGSWSQWLKCGWPPYESDDHFGVTLVALAMSVLPASERSTEDAAKGIAGIRNWLGKHPPANLHHKGMLMWIARHWDDFMPEIPVNSWCKEWLSHQREDGGWRLVDLGAGQWKRADDDLEELPSDAYATAYSIFCLRKGGLPADHPALQKGLQWLRDHQRQSGRWFARSPRKDGHHFISHAATHFALLAFQICEPEASPPTKSD